MRPMSLPVPLLLATLVFATPAALAHKAHQHGVAHMDLVREGAGVEIGLKVDGDGVVGFERAPRDAAERAKVDAARSALGDGAALFGLPAAADCRLVEADVDAPHAENARDPGHSHGHDDKSDGHADWQASYRFECTRAAAADRVDLAGLFTAFPRISRVQLQWITDDAQSGVELRPGRSEARLVAE